MAKDFDFSGLWHSSYQYVNALEPEGNISEHDVKMYKTGNQVVLQSIPNEEKSYLVARLTFDPSLNLLTGTWEEQTSPAGKYKGQVYYGAGQLLLESNSKRMHGKIVVYNHEMHIIAGDWDIVLSDKEG